jgi:parallel beta-helix repeat protein
LTNSTISGNTATQNGGGIHNYSSSDLVLTNVTLSGNGAASGGGLYNDLVAGANIKNTIIANSASGGDCILANGSVISSASANNLLEDNSNACGFVNSVSGNIIGTDPQLGPLQNNGGATETHALLSGSAAFNSGANANCPAADQRGVSRPQGATCDIGAYEKKYSTYSTKSVASQDGLILESTETSGAGGTMNSSAAALSLGDNNVKKQYRSILSFNTAALPDNAVISKVTLKLKHISVLPVGTNPISLLQGIYVDIRKGYFDTFPALQLADFNATASKTAGPFTPALSGGWYTISLNNTTFASINKLTNDNGLTQFRLRFKLDDNNNAIANMLNLASGNNPTTANRPTLIIEYYVP